MFTRNILVILFALLTFFACTGEDSRQMHEALMQAKAQNENFEPFTTDSTMLRVVDYYDSHGTANEQMLAHYLLGCVYRDLGDAPRALECYYDAVSKADTTDADCDFQRLSRIYGQMAELFYNQRSPQYAKETSLHAIRMAWKCKDTLSVLNFYVNLTPIYYLTGRYDSVLHIGQESYNIHMKLGYEKQAYAVLPSLFATYLNNGQYDKAKPLMDLFETKMNLSDDSVNTSKKRILFYYYKAKYYNGINKVDSALYFYKKFLNNSNKSVYYENAYKGLMEVYHKLGKPDSVMKYSLLFANANDSACLISSAEEINRANALYNYNASRRQAKIKEQEAERYRNSMLLFCLLGCLIAFIITLYIIRQKKRIKKAEAIYKDTLNKYKETAFDLKLLRRDHNKYIETKEAELAELKLSLSILDDNTSTEKWDCSRALYESPIMQHLDVLATTGKRISDEELNDFIEAMEKYMPSFCERLMNNNPELTQREIHVCLLSKMGYSSSMIGVLLSLTKQRVTNIRSTANQKLFGEKGAGSLNKNMQNL